MDINAVITGDLVKSRRINKGDIEIVITSLKKTFIDINECLLNGKGSFEIYRGDSFQGLVPEPGLALSAAIILRAKLRTFEPIFNPFINRKMVKPILAAYSDARISIGVGRIDYRGKSVTESQGEAFEKSGHAFDKMIKENERLGIVTPWELANKELAVECSLANAIISRWTSRTAEAMYEHILHGKNQNQLAEQFDISQPAVRKRLEVYGNATSINIFINRYKELIKNNI